MFQPQTGENFALPHYQIEAYLSKAAARQLAR
jgi:hypothetical protein